MKTRGFLSAKAVGYCAELQRIIEAVEGHTVSAADLWPFLRVLHVLSLDLHASSTRQAESHVRTLLAQTATGGEPLAVADASWNTLLVVASKAMSEAHSLRRDDLPAELRHRHAPLDPANPHVHAAQGQHSELRALGIAATSLPEPHGTPTGSLAGGVWSRVHARSDSARAQLNPHSLPRIPRTITETKLLPALRRGILHEAMRVVPIVGAAGYGKSTILGQLYDEFLQDSDTGWVVLLLCGDLTAFGNDGHYQPAQLAEEFGELAGSSRIGLPTVVADLVSQRGRGVVLIDTVDLVVTRRFVPAFRRLLEELMAAGATVAFTCREYEYATFFGNEQAWGSLAPAVDRYMVPEFDVDEVRAATTAFVERQDAMQLPEGETTFADALLSMSAGSHSLDQIVHNPLRLAMLCELFGRDRTVPEDLTVSRLYSMYWERKVASSRKYDLDSAVPLRMQQLCLHMAQLLFRSSDEHLHESLFVSDLLESADADAAAAYSELVSEDVLQVASAGKVRFFHQTFLEYTIARRMVTAQGFEDREALIAHVAQPSAGFATLHWWPILRQLLSITDEPGFDAVTSRIDLQRQAAFRAAAFGAAARESGDALSKLLPVALQEGADFQERLVEAAFTAPASQWETAWFVTNEMVRRAAKPTAINAAKSCGNMLSRSPRELPVRLAEFFDALHSNEQLQSGGRTEVAGFFLAQARPTIEAKPSPEALGELRQHWELYGDDTRAHVIQIHCVPGVSDGERGALLDILLRASPDSVWRQDAVELAEQASSVLVSDAGRWRSWAEFLHADLPPGWSVVQGLVVGRHAARDEPLLQGIARDLLGGPGKHIHANRMALQEACQRGGGVWLARYLDRQPRESLPADRYPVIARLFADVAFSLTDEPRLSISRWLLDPSSPKVESTVAILAIMADADAGARDQMRKLILSLPLKQRDTMMTLALRLVQPSIRDELIRSFLGDVESREDVPTPGQIKLYASLASVDPDALERLLTVARGHRRTAALSAATAVTEAAGEGERPSECDLVSLLLSPFPGVKASGITGLVRLVRLKGSLSEATLSDAAAALRGCDTSVVIGPYCNLVTEWMRSTGYVPMSVLQLIADIPEQSGSSTLDSGIARPVLLALKVAAQTEDAALAPHLSGWAIRFFRWFDMQRIGDGEAELIDLLAACRRQDADFFGRLIQAGEGVPVRNLRAAATAIRRVEGPGSRHLNRLADQPWCPPSVRGLILEWRGA